MPLHSLRRTNITIATLGPRGTDAYEVAVGLSDRIVLFDTFRASLEAALRLDCLALVACGCGSFEASAMDRWVDLHFQYSERLAVLGIESRPVKTLCAAIHRDAGVSPSSVSIHPATRIFAARYFPDTLTVSFETKVAAVRACVERKVDACIGSLDQVRSFSQLQVVDCFDAEMIWVLYGHKDFKSFVSGDCVNYD